MYPLSRAWFGGRRLDPPASVAGGGWLYKLLGGRDLAQAGVVELLSLSFEDCPSWARCAGIPGNSSLTFANIQAHQSGEPAGLEPISRYLAASLEEIDNPEPGTNWYVRITSVCGQLNIGGFELVRVISASGTKVQPFHNEFEEYMEGQPTIVWSGFSAKGEIPV